MEKILEDVLKEIKPNEKERKRLSEVSENLIKKVEEIGSDFEIPIEPKLVGSAARGTWISGERDIDIFLLFPEDTPREVMEEKGLEIGRRVSEGKGREQYAEHPYIKTEIEGFDVDIVPCYDIENPTEIRSAVDRSPHHQEYIEGWLTPERKEEVLLLKKFLKGIEAYGSELKVHGFSGYLCELLIVHKESFTKLIESASEWGSKRVITIGDTRDPEELLERFPESPLIFTDPVDPNRNVAAAVSKENYATFIRACQSFLKNPKREFFFPNQPPTLPDELRRIMKERGTKILMVSLNISYDLVPDIVYPQLRKTERTLVRKLEEADFEVLRSEVWSKDQKAFILLELRVPELPRVRKHIGPPPEVDAEPFIQEHLNSDEKLAGPFINEEGRLVFELRRKPTQGKEALQNFLESPEGFGKHIQKSIPKEGYEILEDEEIVERAERLDALEFLGEYLNHCLPWYR